MGHKGLLRLVLGLHRGVSDLSVGPKSPNLTLEWGKGPGGQEVQYLPQPYVPSRWDIPAYHPFLPLGTCSLSAKAHQDWWQA